MSVNHLVNGKLIVSVIEGKELKKEDAFKNDPYVKVKVHNSMLGKGQSTEVAKGGGSSPKWNYRLEFNLKDTDLKTNISFRVFDKGTLKDDKIGRADITLSQLASHSATWWQLRDFHDAQKVCGYILISSAFEGTGWPTSSTQPMSQSLVTQNHPITSSQSPMPSSQMLSKDQNVDLLLSWVSRGVHCKPDAAAVASLALECYHQLTPEQLQEIRASLKDFPKFLKQLDSKINETKSSTWEKVGAGGGAALGLAIANVPGAAIGAVGGWALGRQRGKRHKGEPLVGGTTVDTPQQLMIGGTESTGSAQPITYTETPPIVHGTDYQKSTLPTNQPIS